MKICCGSAYFCTMTTDPLSSLFCTEPFRAIHQEFQQITELGLFDQQIFRRGLLQRNNFPLHFLSWTKTPFKWMAFAHSLGPQLAVLLPTPFLGSRNRQAEDEGAMGLTQQVHTWNKCNYWTSFSISTSIWLKEVLTDLIYLLFPSGVFHMWNRFEKIT